MKDPFIALGVGTVALLTPEVGAAEVVLVEVLDCANTALAIKVVVIKLKTSLFMVPPLGMCYWISLPKSSSLKVK